MRKNAVHLRWQVTRFRSHENQHYANVANNFQMLTMLRLRFHNLIWPSQLFRDKLMKSDEISISTRHSMSRSWLNGEQELQHIRQGHSRTPSLETSTKHKCDLDKNINNPSRESTFFDHSPSESESESEDSTKGRQSGDCLKSTPRSHEGNKSEMEVKKSLFVIQMSMMRGSNWAFM